MLNIKDIIKDCVNMSSYEKIDYGTYPFLLNKVEFTKTEKSKKDCIKYHGTIINSKGIEQDMVVVDNCDTENSLKFSLSRLFKIYSFETKKPIDIEKLVAIGEFDKVVEIINSEIKGAHLTVVVKEKQLPSGVSIKTKEIRIK